MELVWLLEDLLFQKRLEPCGNDQNLLQAVDIIIVRKTQKHCFNPTLLKHAQILPRDGDDQ
jgi:hypothetical protein